ncbi:glycosyltransferase family protein [Paracidovorax avenae]|uniref:glycosyltransferase family protein n=1 Tax=Paracidovorax avenae TaxID=80867 RepID=UPI0009E791C2|nr:hypothetical protein [Paracidovorax avenae]
MNALNIAEGQFGVFAVVKLWPKIKTAEDECIARLKASARQLGLECIEVHANGERLDQPGVFVSRSNVDFVVHLHYDTPKLYDAFSFVALWNPLQFYHEWGYARTSRNLTTHDDFLSCNCQSADDHVSRMIRNDANHLAPYFSLYHSTPDVVHPPGLGDFKLFYAGINWEAIGKGKSRHQEVLKQLDGTGLLRIYGPEVFQETRVWAGYQSYVREIPFDGISMVHEIAAAGIALVLSSLAHKDAGLMSNRLFESIAAGALVICDENPFAKRNFGDCLLYIDGRLPVEKIVEKILAHQRWAVAHPALALEMIAKSQAIFRKKFILNENLRAVYEGLPARKQAIAARQAASGSNDELTVRGSFLMPSYSDEILEAHLHSIESQDYKNFAPVLVVDRNLIPIQRRNVSDLLARSARQIELLEIDFFNSSADNSIVAPRLLGEIVQEILNAPCPDDAFMLVAPNEKLFSNHVTVLARALARDPNMRCAASAAILTRGDAPIHGVHELLDFGHVDKAGPVGCGRFLFRKSTVPKDIGIALPYMNARALALLVGGPGFSQQMPATIFIDLGSAYPEALRSDIFEGKIIEEYCPDSLVIKTGFGPKPVLGAVLHEEPRVARISLRQFLHLLGDPRWVGQQFQEIRAHGLGARLKIFRKAFGL